MYSAVIDPAPDHAAFALLEDDKVITIERRPMRGRDAAALPVFILETLKSYIFIFCSKNFHNSK